MERPALLIALFVQIHVVLAHRRGQVHPLAVDGDVRWGRHQVDGPNRSGAGGPAVAEDGLIITVDEGQVWRLGKQRKLGGRLVECSLNPATVA